MSFNAMRAVLVGGLLLFISTASSADLAQWDQVRTTRYAQELQTACEDLGRALNAQPPATPGMQRRAFYQARDDIRVMRSSAGALVSKLEDGASMEETLPIFKRIRSLQRSAAEQGRRAMLAADVLDKAVPVGSALIKLRPYYEAEPEVEPDLTPETDAP
jgi:hypothetical protein